MNFGLTITANSEEEMEKKMDWYREKGWIVHNTVKERGSVFFAYCESIPPHDPSELYESLEEKK